MSVALYCPTCGAAYPETEWRQTIAELPVVSGESVVTARELRHARCRKRTAFVVTAAVGVD